MKHTVLAALLCGVTAFAQDSFAGAKRIVAIGDVHGGYEEFVTILRAAGVIDGSAKWIGGATHLVQTGDCLDRGAQSRKVLDLLMALDGPARKAKGRVHALLGNHEAMNMYGDLRYVAPGEYDAFKTGESAKVRDEAYAVMADPAQKDNPAYKAKWNVEHPLGWVEHRQAFAPDGRYGRFLRERPAIVKVNDAVFLHGGISEKFAALSIADINKAIKAELRDFRKLDGGITTAEDGPLWYRGLASGPEEPLIPLLDKLLASWGVSRVVLGHTPTMGAVMPRFNGRVLLIDVGLSKAYNDSPACLILEEDGKAYAMHRGKQLEIPKDAAGIAAYLRAASELDPPASNLRKFVQSMR